ncbi:putative holin-like toxin [Brevibacillus brevis]|nr:putative holin-like toxin [Brevibacillus brevis]
MVTNETLGLLFQFGLFLVALIGLVVTLTKKKRPPLS